MYPALEGLQLTNANELYKYIHSPVGVPGVTDHPVGSLSSGVVTNQLYAVIKEVDESALPVSHNTRLVVLPCGSINTDRQGTHSDEVGLENALAPP